MIDLHSHILPGVDDGANDFDTSIEMLEEAKAAGVTTIIATPHKKNTDHADYRRTVQIYGIMRKFAQNMGLDMKMGWEYNLLAVDVDNISVIKNYCIEGTDLLLLEMPFSSWPFNWERIIYGIQSMGIKLIIAHPERYTPVQNDLSILDTLAEDGCFFQINAGSVLQRQGKRHKVVKYLAKKGRIDFIGSDSHGQGGYDALYDALERSQKKKFGPVYTELQQMGYYHPGERADY